MSLLPKCFDDFVSEIASAYIPGSGTLIRRLFKKRLDAAREILLQEIHAGEKDVWEACEVDEVVAIVYRYMRAAQEGTAQVNLRLLARIIAGQKAAKALRADDFLYYADIIASLRHEEIIIIGTMHKFYQATKVKPAPHGPKEPQWPMAQRVYGEVRYSLIPSVFSSEDEFSAICGALTRTGLIIAVNAVGGMIYAPSPFLEKLCSIASFEDLEREHDPPNTAKVEDAP